MQPSLSVPLSAQDLPSRLSVRSDLELCLTRGVTIYTCIFNKFEEFKTRSSSTYLWKLHADALTFLLHLGSRLQEECASIIQVAEARGLKEKVEAMIAMLERLKKQSITVAKALETTNAMK